MDRFIPMHQHLLIKATIRQPLNDLALFKSMLIDLVNKLGMVAVTAPQGHYVDTLGNEGITGSINLATSHIAMHIWDHDHRLMADIYSCCPFDNDSIVEYLGTFFGGYEEIDYMVINRDTFEVIETYSSVEELPCIDI